jgi:hypothetical protein
VSTIYISGIFVVAVVVAGVAVSVANNDCEFPRVGTGVVVVVAFKPVPWEILKPELRTPTSSRRLLLTREMKGLLTYTKYWAGVLPWIANVQVIDVGLQLTIVPYIR